MRNNDDEMFFEVIKNGAIVDRLNLDTKNQITTFGRGKDSNFTLEHASISRKHASIVYDNNDIFIIDHGSSHGTFLNKQRLNPEERYSLMDGDFLRFGDSTRKYCFSCPSLLAPNETLTVEYSYPEFTRILVREWIEKRNLEISTSKNSHGKYQAFLDIYLTDSNNAPERCPFKSDFFAEQQNAKRDVFNKICTFLIQKEIVPNIESEEDLEFAQRKRLWEEEDENEVCDLSGTKQFKTEPFVKCRSELIMEKQEIISKILSLQREIDELKTITIPVEEKKDSNALDTLLNEYSELVSSESVLSKEKQLNELLDKSKRMEQLIQQSNKMH